MRICPLLIAFFAIAAAAQSVDTFPQDQPPSNPILITSDPPESFHISNERHHNYMIFRVSCPVGKKLVKWNVNYDKEQIYRGLFEARGPRPLKVVKQCLVQALTGKSTASDTQDYQAFRERVRASLRDSFGTIENKEAIQASVNREGKPVEIHAWMRTRLVSPGAEAKLYRQIGHFPKNTDNTLNLYQKYTRIKYECAE